MSRGLLVGGAIRDGERVMNPKERFNLMKWGSFNEHRAAIIEACGQPAASIGEASYDLITDIMEEIFERGRHSGSSSVISKASESVDAAMSLHREVIERLALNVLEQGRDIQIEADRRFEKSATDQEVKSRNGTNYAKLFIDSPIAAYDSAGGLVAGYGARLGVA